MKNLFFVTSFGNPYWLETVHSENGLVKRSTRNDSIGLEFKKILKKLAIKRDGAGFGALRHTFRTVADGCRDVNAICRIMGHSLRGLDEVYVTEIGLDRIRKVTNHVRRWYLR